MKKYIKLLRIKHYLKNILIILPFICGKELFNVALILKLIPGIFAFCLLSSTIYILNDIRDREKDRNHPTKCKRPIASGAISVRCAIIIALVLFVGSIGLNVLTFSSWMSLIAFGAYFILNLGYSFGLKSLPIIDICILVSGFFIRVLYGAIITSIPLSSWMYLTIMSLSFYMALGKRRNELRDNKGSDTRSVLKLYNEGFLDKFMYLCLALTIVFYSLWCVDANTVALLGNGLVWTVPFAIAICMKYSLTVEGNSDGDPVNVIFKDKILLSMILIFAIVFGLLIYL